MRDAPHAADVGTRQQHDDRLQLVQHGNEFCVVLRQCFTGISIFENCFNSRITGDCKQKKPPENGYLESSRLIRSNFIPNWGVLR